MPPLIVYLRTLAPGLIAIVDTPAFQFVGRVLGVPHNPGYPAYVLITHVYSWLPIGTLAYRMNLFSALCGAAAAAGTYVLCRELGSPSMTAAAAALGLALGRVFWSQAVIAEVYTLNAAIAAWMLVSLVMWQRTRRPSHLYASVALLAVGLGNHTTIILFVPGMVIVALATDARFSLRWKTVAFVALMAALALGQYAFILIRTRTPGAYVESPARTVGQLADVIRGKQFSDGLFAFPLRQVVADRIPRLFGGVVIPELTSAGIVLAALGLIRLARTRPADAALLAVSASLALLFALNYDAVDIQVFLIPVFLLLWPCVAQGADAMLAAIPPRLATVAAVCLLVGLPATLIARNYTANDLSREWTDALYFDRVIRGLPARTAIVREDFLVDRMVMYELLGAHAAAGRDVQIVPPERQAILEALSQKRVVLAFPKSADRLRNAGFDVSYAPRRVLGESLPVTVSRLPRGLHAITGPRVQVGGQEALQTNDGIAAVIVTADGGVRDMFVAEAADQFRVPLQRAPVLVYEVRGLQSGEPDLTTLLRRVDRHADAVRMYRDEQAVLIGAGWSAVQRDAALPYRRIDGPQATLLVPLPRRNVSRIRIVTLSTADGAILEPRLNGASLGAQPLALGWHPYEWLIAGGLAKGGRNALVLVTSGAAASSIAVSSVTIHYAE